MHNRDHCENLMQHRVAIREAVFDRCDLEVRMRDYVGA
jgi:hypothetical protein